MITLEDAYCNRRVLITGGLGFIGSTVAHRLVALGAHVTLLDSLDSRYGGNRFNIAGIEDQIRVIEGDVRDDETLGPLVRAADIVFHLAAQVSYVDSLTIPMEDLAVTAGSTLQLLEVCRGMEHKPLVVLASSRMVVGRISHGILTEDAPTNPLSLYGVHKLASEKYLQIYQHFFGVPTIALRITNPYGPRQQIHHNKYSLVGWFVRQALAGETIKVFGDGRQRRDYIFADDIAEAFLRCTAAPEAVGQVVNLGSGVTTEFREMVADIVEIVGTGRVEFVPWPNDYERLETGDVQADVSKLQRLTNWAPDVHLREGIARTADFYRRHLRHYVR
ncbi:MAG: NAD-dependent epimerase/dehydratase family protein [Gemmatimonadaceae bacterium]